MRIRVKDFFKTAMANLNYLASVASSYLDRPMDTRCPYCHHSQADILGRKYWLVQLRKCSHCGLMFRFPKENVSDSLGFYQESYQEGLTTSLPNKEDLENLLNQKFQGSSKDFAGKIDLIKQYKPKGVALDYGCSWGYGVWQLQEAGYKGLGFEVSRPRARYGREKLEVSILDCLDDLNDLPDNYLDIVFSSHVLEHLPDISTVFSLFHRLLKPKGMIALFVPNCDGCDTREGFADKKGFAFGEKHTIAFSSSFLNKTLSEHGFKVLRLEGITTFGFPELMAFAEKL